MKRALFLMILFCLVVIAPLVYAQETKPSPIESGQAEREAMYYRYLEFASYVKGGSITPHWMADGSSFWYAEGAPANTVIWKVDPKSNTKTPLFDTARLRKALTPLLGREPPYQGLPFAEFELLDGEKALKFAVEGKEFILRLDTYAISRTLVLSEEEKNKQVGRILPMPFDWPEAREKLSPDGRWFASLKDHNVWVRSTYDGRGVPLTTDGIEDYEWGYVEFEKDGWAWWSPNSFKLAVKKADYRQVPKIPIVHWLKPTEEVEWKPIRGLFSRSKAGMPLPRIDLFVVDILSKRRVRIDIGEDPNQYIHIIGWRPDGSELLLLRMNREGKRLDLMAANPETGSTRVVLDETQKTFVIGIVPWARASSSGLLLSPLRDGKRLIWVSERDGWNHLYLYDLDGTLLRRLTEGAFPVVEVVSVDEKSGWVYVTAHGEKERPYETHLYRVNLEGKDFTKLTEATGEHHIQFAPSKEFFLDTHSTVTRPPVVELRRADGTLLRTLSKANIDALVKELKWSPPEEFVVKADDGKTDLYGVLWKPYDFDPNKRYPVIEGIYAGPHAATVPRTFSMFDYVEYMSDQALAQLGFIVFEVDGRGTPERGKVFQDVAYGNLGRHEISDHVATLKQLAAERSYMDLSRVGVYGHSTGGYMTIRALLLAPDVYHVGIASAPVVDMSSISTWEIYMGLPQNNREAYEYASNLRLAANLKGKLLLIHGTSDVNAPFSETMKMVEALVRVGKPYDLIVMPEQGHLFIVTNKKYWLEAIRRYFQEHLKP